jgi:hypothetical protein
MAPRYVASRVDLVIFAPLESEHEAWESEEQFQNLKSAVRTPKKITVSGVRFQVSGKRKIQAGTSRRSRLKRSGSGEH